MLSWLFRNRVFLFVWATITGFLFALVWKQYEQAIHQTLTYYRITPSSFDYEWAYRSWLSSQGLHSISSHRKSAIESKTKDNSVREDEWLLKQVPVLCVILTKKLKQSKAIKNTWAKHCNKALFYGSYNDDSIPVNKINAKDSWHFLCEVLSKVWMGYEDEFKWVLIAGDYTYAVVENLRYMIAGLDSNESYYLGHVFRNYNDQYNVEDAGYVLSWPALKVFHEKFPNINSCVKSEYWQNGDWTLGNVLETHGIKPRDTRDIMERARFLPFNLEKLLIPGGISVFSRYWRESVFLSPEGSGCCSDFVVTFSDVTHDKMYMMEYIIYHLKPVSQNWPPVDDIGPPESSNIPVTSTNDKRMIAPKPTSKTFVSKLNNKKNKSVIHQTKNKSIHSDKKLQENDINNPDYNEIEPHPSKTEFSHLTKTDTKETKQDTNNISLFLPSALKNDHKIDAEYDIRFDVYDNVVQEDGNAQGEHKLDSSEYSDYGKNEGANGIQKDFCYILMWLTEWQSLVTLMNCTMNETLTSIEYLWSFEFLLKNDM